MDNFIDIKVLNTPLELNSFPLKQSIHLESSVDLEDSLLEKNIVLIRNIAEYGLLNSGDLYNYNIGYVKESFSTIALNILVAKEGDKYRLKCTPKEVLSPNSSYVLYLDKNLSQEYVSLVKTVSKGPSFLTLEALLEDLEYTKTYVFKVMSSPKITSTMNLIKFQVFENEVPGRYFTINAKSSENLIEHEGLKIRVPDTAFGLDEVFEVITNSESIKLKESLIVEIKTALSEKITVVENIKASESISNADILKYYAELDKANNTLTSTGTINFSDKKWQNSEYSIEHLDEDKFLLTLNNLDVDNLDLDAITYREFPCYNKYDIKALNLYSDKDIYKLTYEILDDKSVLFTAVREVV